MLKPGGFNQVEAEEKFNSQDGEPRACLTERTEDGLFAVTWDTG